ncbi:MAG: hypothetical protein K6E59_04290 [Bacilli bacterium]|nr:hypothetical protein [Bacilli bacterium]
MKKWIWIAIGSAVLVAGGVTFAVVLVNTNNVKASSFEIEGTWQFFEQGNLEQGREFMVFKDGKAQDYIDGKMVRESAYSVTNINATFTAANVTFKDWDSGYALTRKSVTKDIFGLFGDNNEAFYFVRVKDDEHLNASSYSVTDFQNKEFKVLIHATAIKEQEEFVRFTDSTITFIRGDATVVDHAAFKVENSVITAPGFKFYICAIQEQSYRLCEIAEDALTGERAFWPWEWRLL